MNKKPLRKLQITPTTIRILSKEQAETVAGAGYTNTPTCTMTVSTGPFPSNGPCSLPV